LFCGSKPQNTASFFEKNCVEKQYLAQRTPGFPRFQPSSQQLTWFFHTRKGKSSRSPAIHNQSTDSEQPRGKGFSGISTQQKTVFHKFPSPYYDFYNKFNIRHGHRKRIQNTGPKQKGEE
jgi:choline dehydrogenase-like flavoprotein